MQTYYVINIAYFYIYKLTANWLNLAWVIWHKKTSSVEECTVTILTSKDRWVLGNRHHTYGGVENKGLRTSPRSTRSTSFCILTWAKLNQPIGLATWKPNTSPNIFRPMLQSPKVPPTSWVWTRRWNLQSRGSRTNLEAREWLKT